MTIFGDGTQTRDFVYVEDVVRGFAAAGRSDEQGAINLSTGVETSLLELARRSGPGDRGRAGAAGRDRPLDPRPVCRSFASGLGRGDAVVRGPASHARLDDLRKAASEGGGVVSQRSLAGASRRLRTRLKHEKRRGRETDSYGRGLEGDRFGRNLVQRGPSRTPSRGRCGALPTCVTWVPLGGSHVTHVSLSPGHECSAAQRTADGRQRGTVGSATPPPSMLVLTV